MDGYLDLVVLVIKTLGLLLLVIQLLLGLSGVWVLIWLTFLVPGLLLIIGMLMIFPWKCLSILIFGLMVAGRTSSVGGFEIAGAGVYLPELAFDGSVWSMAEEYGDARMERCRAFMPVLGGHADCSAC